MTIDVSKFEKALANLDAQYTNWKQLPGRQGFLELDIEGIGESVVQRFEYTFDTSWKALKRYMESELFRDDLPNSPKPLFKIAGEAGIIDSVENWIQYGEARIGTSHDYSNEKETLALDVAGRFIADAKALLAKMTKDASDEGQPAHS
jgi:nucleotidyltransferase substrate binding protein (TIGR01987 family)